MLNNFVPKTRRALGKQIYFPGALIYRSNFLRHFYAILLWIIGRYMEFYFTKKEKNQAFIE